MIYQQFRKQWFDNLNEDVQRERKSYFALDIETELELLCQDEFISIVKENPRIVSSWDEFHGFQK